MFKNGAIELGLDEVGIKTWKNEYPSLSRRALRFVISFTTTYLCETWFSAMLKVKNKNFEII